MEEEAEQLLNKEDRKGKRVRGRKKAAAEQSFSRRAQNVFGNFNAVDHPGDGQPGKLPCACSYLAWDGGQLLP